ncbi:MAG: hypothetical protein IK115_13065 [Lachnospiraceae bacterium]|nr:hypothetical protein [Lachnospiraceae bacterium]
MLMEPITDITKYQGENGVLSAEDAAKLRAESDAWFEELSELRRSVHAGVCAYKGRINEKLQERDPRAYEDIVRLIKESAYASTARYDDELTRFACTADIYRFESAGDGKCIYDLIEYIEDFMPIYTRMMFMFRRILQGLPHEEYLAWIDQTEISVFAVEGMLKDVPIGGKDVIASVLAEHYRQTGRMKEADYLCKVTEESNG